jgi:PKD repeat protein
MILGFLALFPIAASAQPAARFVYGCQPRTSWCGELTCTFDGSSSTTSPGATINGYRWYFRGYLAEDRESESATRTGVRVTRTYTNTRCRSYTYYVTLEVTDSLGNKNLHAEQVDASRRLDLPPTNQQPFADFTASCNNFECLFDASASNDPDGSIVSYSWDFGDGGTANGVTILHTYSGHGSYIVRLTVADNQGATTNRAKTVSVIEPGFNLTATGRVARGGLHKVDLRWTGATSDSVDVYRNGVFIATTPNDGIHTDDIDLRGRGAYTHRVCERGTGICSNETTVLIE